MLGLTTKKRIRKNNAAWEAAMQREETFAAVPVPAPFVDAKADARGHLHLRFEPPPKPGMASWMARRFKIRPRVRYELDEGGTRFWQAIDGKRPLADIAAQLEEPLGLSRDNARRAAALFTYDLMCRNLLLLKTGRDQPHESQG